MKGVLARVGSLQSRLSALALAFVLSLFASVPAFAQGGGAAVSFDPAPVLEIVTDATTFIVAVGIAVLTMLMVAKGIKWARKAG